MHANDHLSRREFLELSARLGAAGVAATGLPRAAWSEETPSTSPNERIRLGFIGVGARGLQVLEEFLKQPDVEVTAICDVWGDHIRQAVEKCPNKPSEIKDYRDLLSRKDVDAVVICTPPHWHCLQAIHACESGKDFYIEKPMTMSVGESLAVRNAVRHHNRITQIGTQIHAGDNYRRVVEIVRSGILGKIGVIRTVHVGNQGPDGLGEMADCDPPRDLDWNQWCGPAKLRAFNPLIAKGAYEHGSFMDYSGGWTPGMAPHILDLPYWALNLDHPIRVSSSGGRYIIQDPGDAYDTHEVLFQYPNFTLTWSSSIVNACGYSLPGPEGTRRTLAIVFQGVNATLVTDYSSHDIVPELGLAIDSAGVPESVPNSPGHYREWLDCLRSRKQPSCHVGYHYKIDVAIQLSLVSLKLGRSVAFDPVTETIPNDPEAQKLVRPIYRKPWRFPDGYLS
ncbi:MAG: Inositol 2-dehydrogenase/D-chiro-inositol 3-dehydrogenase [bacterium]|nr:Inositol 2-dehydrogenase/D-chiro-inositol 3-dehydrogenase [bacterium]